jgi:hypothetical protein
MDGRGPTSFAPVCEAKLLEWMPALQFGDGIHRLQVQGQLIPAQL